MKKFFSIFSAAALIAAFSTFTFAQETKTDAPKADKAQRQVQPGRKFGRMGKMGRMGRMGRMGHMGHMGKMGRMMMHKGGAFKGLNLTDAQKEQIKAIREANRPDKALLDEIRTIHQSRKAGTDLTAEQKARINTIRDQMRTRAQNAHDQIQNVLTADQRAEVAKRRAEMQTRREEMRKMFEERRLRRQAKPGDPVKPADVKKPAI